jgi:hypothetical protein
MKEFDLPVNYAQLKPWERKVVREQYIRQQDGKCCHCNALLDGKPSASMRAKQIKKHLFPSSFFMWPVHLHHCHKTGMTIGAVHDQCNAVLWQYYGK